MTDCANSIFLDEVRRLHESYDALAARVAKLEETRRGSSMGDGMGDVMFWIAVAYIASMLIPPLIQVLRGAACVDSR